MADVVCPVNMGSRRNPLIHALFVADRASTEDECGRAEPDVRRIVVVPAGLRCRAELHDFRGVGYGCESIHTLLDGGICIDRVIIHRRVIVPEKYPRVRGSRRVRRESAQPKPLELGALVSVCKSLLVRAISRNIRQVELGGLCNLDIHAYA